jgi:SAM-dependent methyltransferase
MPSPVYEPSHCIVCGHADSRVVAEQDEIRRQVENLREFHQRRLKAGAPIEHLRDRVAFSQHPPFRLVQCVDCGLVYRNPAERSHEVESAYARDEPPRATLETLHRAQRNSYGAQAKRLRELLPRGATVLEVGSYVGAFLAEARDQGLNAVGIDINPAANRFTRSLGFAVRDGELGDADATTVDAIAIWNTFDQLADPRGTLSHAATRLKPGGVLALRVPNGGYFAQAVASATTAGMSQTILAQNNLLAFPYRWGFTPGSVSELLDQLGLRVVRTVGDVLVPTADRWTRPWARWEERAVKAILRRKVRDHPDTAPWFEVYATALPPEA